MKTRYCLLTAFLFILRVAACNDAPSTETLAEAGKVIIVTVNPDEQYVEIRNDSRDLKDLGGWSLSLCRRKTCHLDDGLALLPGQALHIWALVEDADQEGYNCGLDSPFWSGEEPMRTFLYDGAGELVDEYLSGEG
jgi:hypothetical protein